MWLENAYCCVSVCVCVWGQDCGGNGGMCLIEICHRAGDVRDLSLTWGEVSAYTHQSPGVRPAFSESSVLRYISTGWQTNAHSCQPFGYQSTLHKWKFCTTTEQKTDSAGRSGGKSTHVNYKAAHEFKKCVSQVHSLYLAWQCWCGPCGSSLIDIHIPLSWDVFECQSLWKTC